MRKVRIPIYESEDRTNPPIGDIHFSEHAAEQLIASAKNGGPLFDWSIELELSDEGAYRIVCVIMEPKATV